MKSNKYLAIFSALFLKLTGIKAEEAVVDEHGWLFVPPEVVADEKHKHDLGLIKAPNYWRENLVDDKVTGLWVKPWPDIQPGFIALTLTEDGAGFTYLKDGKAGQRHAYFIDRVMAGSISGQPMLLGQFLFEFEGAPEDALRLSSGGSNRIYYPYDKRIASYDPLTDEERKDVEARLCALGRSYPAEASQLATQKISTAVGTIDRLVAAL